MPVSNAGTELLSEGAVLPKGEAQPCPAVRMEHYRAVPQGRPPHPPFSSHSILFTPHTFYSLQFENM